VFGFVDVASDAFLDGPLPWQAVVGIFIGLSLRSRLLSPLDNSRPNTGDLSGSGGANTAAFETDAALPELLAKECTKTQLQEECELRGLSTEGGKEEMVRQLGLYLQRPPLTGERTMPSWTPPGVVFPLMWVGVVAPLRAFAASLVYEASTGRLNEGHLNDPVLLWLVFHLCVGDAWNTVNNVERRTGAAVPGVACVLGSALFAARQYYDVSPLAGGLLGLTCVWITVASVLVADTWRVNNAVKPEPLFPYRRRGAPTRFWFE